MDSLEPRSEQAMMSDDASNCTDWIGSTEDDNSPNLQNSANDGLENTRAQGHSSTVTRNGCAESETSFIDELHGLRAHASSSVDQYGSIESENSSMDEIDGFRAQGGSMMDRGSTRSENSSIDCQSAVVPMVCIEGSDSSENHYYDSTRKLSGSDEQGDSNKPSASCLESNYLMGPCCSSTGQNNLAEPSASAGMDSSTADDDVVVTLSLPPARRRYRATQPDLSLVQNVVVLSDDSDNDDVTLVSSEYAQVDVNSDDDDDCIVASVDVPSSDAAGIPPGISNLSSDPMHLTSNSAMVDEKSGRDSSATSGGHGACSSRYDTFNAFGSIPSSASSSNVAAGTAAMESSVTNGLNSTDLSDAPGGMRSVRKEWHLHPLDLGLKSITGSIGVNAATSGGGSSTEVRVESDGGGSGGPSDAVVSQAIMSLVVKISQFAPGSCAGASQDTVLTLDASRGSTTRSPSASDQFTAGQSAPTSEASKSAQPCASYIISAYQPSTSCQQASTACQPVSYHSSAACQASTTCKQASASSSQAYVVLDRLSDSQFSKLPSTSKSGVGSCLGATGGTDTAKPSRKDSPVFIDIDSDDSDKEHCDPFASYDTVCKNDASSSDKPSLANDMLLSDNSSANQTLRSACLAITPFDSLYPSPPSKGKKKKVRSFTSNVGDAKASFPQALVPIESFDSGSDLYKELFDFDVTYADQSHQSWDYRGKKGRGVKRCDAVGGGVDLSMKKFDYSSSSSSSFNLSLTSANLTNLGTVAATSNSQLPPKKRRMSVEASGGAWLGAGLGGEEGMEEGEDSMVDAEAEARCCKCGKGAPVGALSYCTRGCGCCGQCILGQVKTLLATTNSGSLECQNVGCNSCYPASQLRNTLPAMVVEILEEKQEREILDSVSIALHRAVGDELLGGGAAEGEAGAEGKKKKEKERAPRDDCTAVPGHWAEMSASEDYKLVTVELDSNEYIWIAALFHESMCRTRAHIIRIRRVQNHILWQFYHVKKKEMTRYCEGKPVKELHLFHGTSASVVPAICANNFDWRNCGTHGVQYGDGSYFATDASYSHLYTDNGRTHPHRRSAPPRQALSGFYGQFFGGGTPQQPRYAPLQPLNPYPSAQSHAGGAGGSSGSAPVYHGVPPSYITTISLPASAHLAHPPPLGAAGGSGAGGGGGGGSAGPPPAHAQQGRMLSALGGRLLARRSARMVKNGMVVETSAHFGESDRSLTVAPAAAAGAATNKSGGSALSSAAGALGVSAEQPRVRVSDAWGGGGVNSVSSSTGVVSGGEWIGNLTKPMMNNSDPNGGSAGTSATTSGVAGAGGGEGSKSGGGKGEGAKTGVVAGISGLDSQCVGGGGSNDSRGGSFPLRGGRSPRSVRDALCGRMAHRDMSLTRAASFDCEHGDGGSGSSELRGGRGWWRNVGGGGTTTCVKGGSSSTTAGGGAAKDGEKSGGGSAANGGGPTASRGARDEMLDVLCSLRPPGILQVKSAVALTAVARRSSSQASRSSSSMTMKQLGGDTLLARMDRDLEMAVWRRHARGGGHSDARSGLVKQEPADTAAVVAAAAGAAPPTTIHLSSMIHDSSLGAPSDDSTTSSLQITGGISPHRTDRRQPLDPCRAPPPSYQLLPLTTQVDPISTSASASAPKTIPSKIPPPGVSASKISSEKSRAPKPTTAAAASAKPAGAVADIGATGGAFAPAAASASTGSKMAAGVSSGGVGQAGGGLGRSGGSDIASSHASMRWVVPPQVPPARNLYAPYIEVTRSGTATAGGWGCLHGAMMGGREEGGREGAGEPPSRHTVFLAKVLVGRSALGRHGYRKPPPLDPAEPYGRCYDSCVNSVESPSMYVVFNSAQCYPEYIIDYDNEVGD